MYNTYRNRIINNGSSVAESVRMSSKKGMVDYILNSPSLSYVFINMDETLPIPTVAKDINNIHKRSFLFTPDMNVNIGDYITQGEDTYLATDKNSDDISPVLIGELCNSEFPIETKEISVIVDYDSLGRPIIKKEKIVITKPCVASTKIYSVNDNSAIPLPDGAMTVKLPYSEDESQLPKENQTIVFYGNQFKVTTLNYTNVYKGHGTIEISLQREPIA